MMGTEPALQSSGGGPAAACLIRAVSRVIQISPARVIKNSPPGLSGRRRFLHSDKPRFQFLLEPIGMASDIDGDRMMEHPIQNRGRQDPVPKHFAPGTEALITRENHRALLVAARDELEKHIGSGPVHRQITNFIDDQQAWDGVEFQLVLQSILRQRSGEDGDHGRRRRKQHPVALRNRFESQPNG